MTRQRRGRSPRPASWARSGAALVLRTSARGSLRAGAGYAHFDDLWDPLGARDGSPGAYYAELQAPHREALRQEVLRRLGSPTGPFRLTARAWCVQGNAYQSRPAAVRYRRVQ